MLKFTKHLIFVHNFPFFHDVVGHPHAPAANLLLPYYLIAPGEKKGLCGDGGMGGDGAGKVLLQILTDGAGDSLPLKTGSEIGNLNVFAGNRLLFSSALYTMNDITSKSALYAAENYRGEVRVEYGSKAEQIYCKQRDGVQEGSR